MAARAIHGRAGQARGPLALAPARLLRLAGDERLVALVRAGSAGAFEAIYDRHHRPILSFCRHMLGQREEAEDVVQHTFLAAYDELVATDRPIQLRAWLFTVARNRCVSVLRARREVPSATLPEPATAGLAAEVEHRADLRAMLGDLAALPEDQRSALVLSELGALSHAEIATVIGVRPAKVKALVFQARESLTASRGARETPCAEVREQLATRGGAGMRRSLVRRHLAICDGCRAFKAEVDRQQRAFALLLPVIPSLALKHGALPSAAAAGAGGTAAGAGTVAATVLKGGGAKLLAAAALVGAGGAGTVAVVEHAAPQRPPAAPAAAAAAAARGLSDSGPTAAAAPGAAAVQPRSRAGTGASAHRASGVRRAAVPGAPSAAGRTGRGAAGRPSAAPMLPAPAAAHRPIGTHPGARGDVPRQRGASARGLATGGGRADGSHRHSAGSPGASRGHRGGTAGGGRSGPAADGRPNARRLNARQPNAHRPDRATAAEPVAGAERPRPTTAHEPVGGGTSRPTAAVPQAAPRPPDRGTSAPSDDAAGARAPQATVAPSTSFQRETTRTSRSKPSTHSAPVDSAR